MGGQPSQEALGEKDTAFEDKVVSGVFFFFKASLKKLYLMPSDIA